MAFGDVVQSNTGTSTLATVSPTLPGAVTAGNIVVLLEAADDYPSGANTGWTKSTGLSQAGGLFHGSNLWWFLVTSNGQAIPSVTIGSAVRSNWHVAELAGPFDVSPYDTSNGQSANTGGSSYTTPAIPPTTGSRLLIAANTFQNSSSDLGAPGTWLNSFLQITSTVFNGANPRLSIGMARRVVTGDGVTTFSSGSTMASGSALSRAGLIIAFKAGSGGSPITKNITDTLGLTDTATPARGIGRTIADNLGLTDLRSTIRDTIRAIADLVGLGDLAARALGLNRQPADPLGAIDATTRQSGRGAAPADTAGLDDEITIAHGYGRAPADQLATGDTATARLDRGRAPADPLPLDDEVTVTRQIVRTVTDTIALADQALPSTAGDGEQTIADAAGIADHATPILTRIRQQADPAELDDDVTITLARARTLADLEALGDQVVVRLDRHIVIHDGIALDDHATTGAPDASGLYLGDTPILGGYVGDTPVVAIYLGDTPIWP